MLGPKHSITYMRGDLNVRNAKHNLSVSLHPAAGQALGNLADFYSLVCSILVLYTPTNYSDI